MRGNEPDRDGSGAHRGQEFSMGWSTINTLGLINTLAAVLGVHPLQAPSVKLCTPYNWRMTPLQFPPPRRSGTCDGPVLQHAQ